jgi:hypothetical protein
VRLFLDKGDWRRRVLGMAKLYLELPDIGMMHGLRLEIMRAIATDPAMLAAAASAGLRQIDEETLEIEVGGISVILTCKQRFMTEAGKGIGYHSVNFIETVWPKGDGQ